MCSAINARRVSKCGIETDIVCVLCSLALSMITNLFCLPACYVTVAAVITVNPEIKNDDDTLQNCVEKCVQVCGVGEKFMDVV